MPFLIFILGLAIGSFLNVLILRLPQGKSILGFSKCPVCQKGIIWRDNIPIFSFILLKGRCRNCPAKISGQYPFVESLAGFLFLILFLLYGKEPAFLVYSLFLASLLIVIAFIDFRRFVILDNLILAGFLIAILYLILNASSSILNCGLISCSLKDSLSGVLFFAGIFAAIFLASGGRWLGFGDVKFAALLGFIFGLKNSISLFYLTFFLGFIIAIILLVLKKADLRTKVPLGSIMAGASILFLLSGFNISDLINGELIIRLWTRN